MSKSFSKNTCIFRPNELSYFSKMKAVRLIAAAAGDSILQLSAFSADELSLVWIYLIAISDTLWP